MTDAVIVSTARTPIGHPYGMGAPGLFEVV